MSAPPELLATTEQLLASCLQQISPWDPCQVPRPLFAQETPSRPTSWPPPSHWLGTRARAASDWSASGHVTSWRPLIGG